MRGKLKNGACESPSEEELRAPRRLEAGRQGLVTILRTIRSGEATTRQEIERVTGMGRAVVVDRLNALEDLGLIGEGSLGESTGGRAPRLVRPRNRAGLILTAFLDRAALGVGLADLSGKLLTEHFEPIDFADGAEATLNRLCTLFDWLLEQHQGAKAVWGVGIAVPGPVETRRGEARAPATLPHIPNWGEYPVTDRLLARYGADVWILSNVEAMTLGEMSVGSAVGVSDLVYLKLGKGLSAGIVCGGRLYRGAQGGAGQIGHVLVDPNSTEICTCGNTGCLDTVAGGDAIAREGARAARDGRSPALAEAIAAQGKISLSDVAFAAQQGDAFSAELLASSGRVIGRSLAAVTNLLNPDLIVIGGSHAQTGDGLLSGIREVTYRQSHPLVSRELRIVSSRMANSGGLVGMARVVVDDLFSEETLGLWVIHGTPLRDPRHGARVDQARALLNSGRLRSGPPVARALP